MILSIFFLRVHKTSILRMGGRAQFDKLEEVVLAGEDEDEGEAIV